MNAETPDPDRELLKAEYLHLQTVIVTYDGQLLTIKAWSVTASLAAVGAAFTYHQPVLLLIAAISSVLFWLTEAHWKAYQHAYYDRLEQLEAYFAKRAKDVVPMQTWTEWLRSFTKRWWRDAPKRLFLLSVLLPHAVVAAAAAAAYFFARAGQLTV